MGRAGPLRHLRLLREHVDGDDLTRPADPRALDDREPDPAAAEDRDGLPGFHPRTSQRRADPGQHAAADQGGAVERDFRVDPHHRILVQQHLFRVARNRR